MDIFVIRNDVQNIFESLIIKINVVLINLKWKVGMKRFNFGIKIYVYVYFLILYLYINKFFYKIEFLKLFVDFVSF